jgi:chemotaxis protein methyltransferase CheR
MKEDGILYLGGAETVLGVSESFRPVTGQRGLYATTDAGGTSWDEAPAETQAAAPPLRPAARA